jgi:hypothetical protein
MKNDFFDASGDMFPVNKNFTNDIISNATGDINQACQLNLPYSNAEMDNLRNIVSVAEQNKAKAQAIYDTAYREWKTAGIFAKSGKKSNRDATEVVFNAAEKAYDAAIDDYNRAMQANSIDQQKYDSCISQQTELLKLQPVVVPSEDKTSSNKDIAVAATATTTNNSLKYGLIGIGITAVLVIGYFTFKK